MKKNGAEYLGKRKYQEIYQFVCLDKFYTPTKYVLSLKFWSLYFRLCEMKSGRHVMYNVSSNLTIVQVIF